MGRFTAWLQRTMRGRYGQDQFGTFLSVLAVIIFIVSLFTVQYVYFVSLLIIGYEYFRFFSRNRAARAKENAWFMRNTAWFRRLMAKLGIKKRGTGYSGGYQGYGSAGYQGRPSDAAQRANYKIFKCPQCGQKLRVPRGRGKIEVRCRKCGTTFVRRS